MMRDMKGADAGALGAKTARACDSCLRRRARWFCASDDAFLCHSCDTLVHSANQLASRHERVRLQTASSKVTTARAWHSGFTRKARTPRHNKHVTLQQQRLKEQVLFNNNSILPLVPEISGEDAEPSTHVDEDETEEQLLCRVPVFDPFDSEQCSAYNDIKNDSFHESGACDLDSFDIDLAEFAADVESLLGSSGEVFDHVKEESEVVKVKDEEFDGEIACHLDSVLDMTNDDEFQWNVESVFSPEACAKEEELEKETVGVSNDSTSVGEEGTKREIFLRLNYDEVINAWTSKGSSWTTSNPSQFILDDDSWSNCLGWSGTEGELRSLRGRLGGSGDGAREARVSRYREKRRTRLFAKKIRYEVRKLNAEKRPRMKGRFVKRTCFVGGATTPFPPNYH